MNDTYEYINDIINNSRLLRDLPAEVKDEVFRALEEQAFEIQYLKHEWEETDGQLDVMSADLRDARREIDELKDELEQVYTERDEAWTRLAEIEPHAK